MRTIVMGLAILLGSTACGKADPPPPTDTKPAAASSSVAPAADPAAAKPNAEPARKKVEIQIASVGDTMAYDKTMLFAPTGAEVHLILKNNGTQAVMTHNWVLVKPGTEAAVAHKGLNEAPDAGYVVPGPDILAFTAMSAPKSTVDITFVAPAPGKYPYICTFPGHYMLMKGILTVTP